MLTLEISCYQSPLGIIAITTTETEIVALRFIDHTTGILMLRLSTHVTDLAKACIQQLDDYFAGKNSQFTLPTQCLVGSPFQQHVWGTLEQIPYGTTCSYADIARKISNPKAVRAVANAIGSNPIPLIIPCHRVIGSDGSLTGYSGGLWRKKWLLEHESSKK